MSDSHEEQCSERAPGRDSEGSAECQSVTYNMPGIDSATSGLLLLSLCCLLTHTQMQENPTGCSNRPMLAEGQEFVSLSPGSHNSLPGHWPWLVSIQIAAKDGTYGHICGGSIINENWVLTAAHCFKAKVANNLAKIMLVFGLEQLSKFSPNTYARPVKEIIKHENYNPDTESNDIALIKVSEPVIFTNYVQPVCLQYEKLDIAELKPCVAMGWGLIEGKGKRIDVLQEEEVNIIPTVICNQGDWYNGSLNDKVLCAGFEWGGVDRCETDSGGPLVCKVLGAGRFYQIGVTSWGLGCSRIKHPGIYTSVRKYTEWIEWKVSRLGEAQMLDLVRLIPSALALPTATHLPTVILSAISLAAALL